MGIEHGTEHLLAYVGPGPGLTMVWAFIVLLGTIALAFLSLLAWPFRMLIRRLRGTTKSETEVPPPQRSPVDPRNDSTTP